MKHNVFIAVCIFLAAFFISCNSPRETILTELDDVILKKDSYRKSFEARLDSLKMSLDSCSSEDAAWDIAYALSSSYRYYDLDSSARYVQIMKTLNPDGHKLRNTFSDVLVLATKRDYDGAQHLLESIDPAGLTASELYGYYRTQRLLCMSVKNDMHIDEAVMSRYNDLHKDVLKKITSLEIISEKECTKSLAALAYIDGDYVRSNNLYQSIYPEEGNLRSKAGIAYSMAKNYAGIGDDEMYIRFLAEAAIIDLKAPAREYRSLYDLALALNKAGDYKRAGEYIQLSLADAISCNFDTRIINSAEAQMVISSSRTYNDRRNFILLSGIFTLTSLLLISIALMLVRNVRQRRHLKKLFIAMKNLNAELQDSNRIKDSYISRFMELSADCLKNVDGYNHLLRKTYKSRGTDALLALIREPAHNYMYYGDFYRMYDEILLGLFPDFVSKVNELFVPSYRLELKGPGRLSTELRILAAIRIGVTSTGKIADILNCTAQTVSSYRTRMKNAYKGNRDDFEMEIRRIGL